MHPNPLPQPGTRYWLVLVVIGLIGGLLSGAFGVGGGIIMVPLLVSIGRMDHRRAATTSLVAIIPASLVGSVTYLANHEIDVAAGVVVAVGAVAGALIGSRLLRRIPLGWLRWMFIALLLVVAARLVFVAPVRGEHLDLSPLSVVGLVGLGLLMGIASGLFGIGGGVIAVPALIAIFGMSDLVAKGTSLLAMLPTSVAGTIANARAGAVDVRAGVVVGVTAAAASVGGVALALVMQPRVSGILFACLLVIAAVQQSIAAIRLHRSSL